MLHASNFDSVLTSTRGKRQGGTKESQTETPSPAALNVSVSQKVTPAKFPSKKAADRFCSGDIQLTVLQNYVARFRETFVLDGLCASGVDCVTPVPAGGVFTPDGLYEFCVDSVTLETGKFTANYFTSCMASSTSANEITIVCVHQHVDVRGDWAFFFLSRCR